MGLGRRTRKWAGALIAVVVAAVALPLIDPWGSPATAAPGLPAGFVEDTVLSGLNGPTAVRFSPDGRVFVAEKAGIVKVFDSLSDPTPDVFADLRTKVHNFWDRGMLGLALHPNFPATPYVYVSYTHDAAIGGTAPRWGATGVSSDPCPTPPGPTADGCVVSGRISRLTASGNTMTGPEQVLVEDWCQQYPSHSVGALAFGVDGMLYGGGGDGANFNFLDYGQDGNPVNPCGDPGGAAPAPPTAEGGALRSQDLRTSGDSLGLNGSILRIDPLTGAGLADNPLGSSPDANARRIVATGLRNPFRLAIRPGTNEVWVADVGGGLWEEIDVIASPTDGSVDNFGWPCYEGAPKHPGFDPLDLSICENLYTQPGAVSDPFFAYQHNAPTLPDGACPAGGASIAGIAFAPASGGTYPSSFAGAAFFADFSRNCIWVMRAGPDGRPSTNLVETFATDVTDPVDLQIGPDGALHYVDIYGGSVRRIRYVGETTPPTIATKAPAPGATGVAVDANVSVTFSESMDASTIEASRLVLRSGGPSGPVVPASVTYEAALLRAVIDPVAPLPASTAVHVLVKGGATGVKDTAGNWLAADVSWSFTTSAGPPPLPANDAFGSAQVVSGGSGSVSGSTVGATKESGEPAHAAGNPGGASVWFRWTAPASGSVTVATTGSSFDTLLGVYTGSSVSTLTVVASNDDLSGSVAQSSVTFSAVAGTTYQIALDGWRTGSTVATGSVNLTWSGPGGPPPVPANDAFGSAQVVSGGSGSVSGSTVGATKESGEPAHAAGNPGGSSVWFRWTAQASGSATVATTGSSFDTLLGVYTGSSVSALTVVASNDDLSASVFQSNATFTAVAGTTYQIAVDGWRTAAGAVATGTVNLSWSGPGGPPPVPANDAFGSAQVVSGGSGSVSGSTVGATKESGEPAHAAENPGGASVWFRWTAPASGPATVATTGSSFDTLLGVYTGSSVSALTVVASNDDLSGSVAQSSVTFSAVAGTTYQIGVDGWRNDAGVVATGAVDLSWSGPAPPDTDAPRPEIIDPSAATKWSVGDTIGFRGAAVDDQDGVLPASGLRWELLLQHCPAECHAHQIEEYPGVATGSFVAPDHEYPSHLELRLTATDSSGRSTTVSRRLDPLTVDLGFASVPPGLGVGVDGVTTTTPFARTVIVGSAHTLTAPATQSLGGNDYAFVSWSDGGARVHDIVAPATPTTFTMVTRDATAPTVTSTWPVAGSTNANRDVNSSAVFSEAMNPATITTATVTLRQGGPTGPLVAATITYNATSRTVTIDPAPRLASKTTYTVVAQGGGSGVKDLAGNALATTFTLSFTTR